MAGHAGIAWFCPPGRLAAGQRRSSGAGGAHLHADRAARPLRRRVRDRIAGDIGRDDRDSVCDEHGMITIGQAPRQDIAPIVERHLAGRAAYQAAIEPLKDKVDVLLMD